MQHKKMTLRFDCNRPEDRQAWEYLQSLHAASMNKAVLEIINRAARRDHVQAIIRSIVREEITAALSQSTVQPKAENDGETDDNILNFLDNFM